MGENRTISKLPGWQRNSWEEIASHFWRNVPGVQLNSWKEIASYFGRDVRTVQRWEKEGGLPVHRKVHNKLSSIYAYTAELDEWWGRGRAAVYESFGPAGSLRRPMLVVLPLKNLSGRADQEYFSDGFTEELIGQLSRLAHERLSVIARGSAMVYKHSTKGVDQIARELGVEYVLDGSVRRDGSRVRISVALIRAKERTNLWTQDYDRDLSDVLSLQAEVARSVSSEVVAKVSTAAEGLVLRQEVRVREPLTPKVDPEAYNAYLLGRYFWNRRTADGIKKAMRYFEEACDRDPAYAAPYAGVADCYALLASVRLGILAPNEAMPKAKASAKKALDLDAGVAEAHAALGYASLWYDWDWLAAERWLEGALILNPTYASALQWHSYYLQTVDRLDEAIAQLRGALELDPLSLQLRTSLSSMRYFERQYDLVIDESKTALEMEPSLVLAYFNLGRAYSQKKMHKEAIAELKRARELSRESPPMTMQLGYAYAMAGQKAEAIEMIDFLARVSRKAYVPAFYTGAIYTGLGDKERAFQWLRRAYDERCDYMIHLPKEPASDPLRSDPRFDGLLPRPKITVDE